MHFFFIFITLLKKVGDVSELFLALKYAKESGLRVSIHLAEVKKYFVAGKR